MAETYDIDAAHRLVTVRPTGVSTAAGLAALVAQIGQDPAFRPQFRILLDLRDSEGLRADALDLRRVLLECPVLPGVRRAMVVPAPVYFRLADIAGHRLRWMRELLQRELPEMRLFTDLEEAQSWLHGRPGPVRRMFACMVRIPKRWKG